MDVLVNNAGITRDVFLHKMSLDQWQAVVRVNLDLVFNMSRMVIEVNACSLLRPHHQHRICQWSEGADRSNQLFGRKGGYYWIH